MRVLFLFFAILTFSAKELAAQNNSLGLGTANPHASAAFEIMDTAKGFLPPRMTTAQRNAISSPAQGLIVFNTTTKCLDVYTGNSWISYCDGACYPPPVTSNAGPDQNVSNGSVSTILAGNSPSYGSGLWTIESGVGGSLGSPSSFNSSFSGAFGSSYTLKWTISNACGSNSDLVVINIVCAAGTANCNGSAVDGCEINTNTSISNCGSCGNVCTIANGVATCTNGVCAVASCNGNFANCDGNPANGCEVNLSSSLSNCGGCGIICTDGLSCTTDVCNNGMCISVINSGFCRISGQCYSNGQSNPSNPCQVCNSSVSQTAWTNAANGTVCATGKTCSNGTCVTTP